MIINLTSYLEGCAIGVSPSVLDREGKKVLATLSEGVYDYKVVDRVFNPICTQPYLYNI